MKHIESRHGEAFGIFEVQTPRFAEESIPNIRDFTDVCVRRKLLQETRDYNCGQCVDRGHPSSQVDEMFLRDTVPLGSLQFRNIFS